MTPDTPLLPCPFCGGKATVYKVNGGPEFDVCCDYMGCCYGGTSRNGTVGYTNKSDVVSLWNRRAKVMAR